MKRTARIIPITLSITSRYLSSKLLGGMISCGPLLNNFKVLFPSFSFTNSRLWTFAPTIFCKKFIIVQKFVLMKNGPITQLFLINFRFILRRYMGFCSNSMPSCGNRTPKPYNPHLTTFFESCSSITY